MSGTGAVHTPTLAGTVIWLQSVFILWSTVLLIGANKMSCRGCIGIWMHSVSWRAKCWQDRRKRNVTTVSNLTYWVKAESAVFSVVAEEKVTLHCDVPFDLLSWRWRHNTVLLLKTAMFERSILTHWVPVWSKTETVWEGTAKFFWYLMWHTEVHQCCRAGREAKGERLHSDLFFTSPFFSAYPGGRGV